MRPHEHYTDEELVRLLLATRDETLRAELWEEFWCRFQPVIALTVKRRLACRRRFDNASVDDLVQNTFLKICKDNFRGLRNFEFRHANALRGWLKVMAANVVEDYFRQQPIMPDEDLEPIKDIIPTSVNVSELIHRREQIQKIEDCLQKMAGEPDFARNYKTFWLYFRDGFTAKQISRLPDLGFNTVKAVESALLRMTKWVRQCLESH
jgi:RNA polymerase sigma-70 factor (ECF subfamily)